VVYAGMEPMTFKALFPYWNDTPDVIRIQKQVCTVAVYHYKIHLLTGLRKTWAGFVKPS